MQDIYANIMTTDISQWALSAFAPVKDYAGTEQFEISSAKDPVLSDERET